MSTPDVSENSALHYLYVIGGVALIVGVIASIIGSANLVSSDSYTGGATISQVAAYAQTAGNGLALLGALAIIGGAIAQAINWQMVNPKQDAHIKTKREYEAERGDQ
ncbi:hypothetical protein [Leifsonia sp. WHRI 6310E]|uniref:hypothetical protein n=1 Tax=Leifsonia sp. WHRI 6310E TaxID=3162562 RepID=UPI0032F05B33